MRTFADIEASYAQPETSAVWLQSIPYDGSSTWGKGADRGFNTFLEAAVNLELYDIETDSEVYKAGIHILPAVEEDASPEAVYAAVRQSTAELLKADKFLTFFGGEHSVSIGIIDAYLEKYPDLTVLQLDAHADLRKSYLGSEFNHACAVHRASQNANLIQVGIRSMDISEKQYMNYDKCYFADTIARGSDWMDASIAQMSDKVYLTIDMDVFDPGIMPATGTPEPGGLDWYTVVHYLAKVFESKQVVGFDLVEFAPIEGLHAPGFLAAKLYYKLLAYRFKNHGK